MTLRAVTLLAALAALAPRAAGAAVLTLEALYGFARPPSADLRTALDEDDLADDALQIAGANVLLNLGGFQLGAIVDTTFGGDTDQTAIGALAGVRLGDKLRLDALAEAGGHRFGNVLDSPEVVSGSSADEWLFYVGLRPGVAYRFDFGPTSAGLVLGVWGFVRWDVNSGETAVRVSGDVPGTVELGGTTIGAVLRAGIEL